MARVTAGTPDRADDGDGDGPTSIVVKDLVVSIGEARLLDHVSLRVPRGGWLALLGPNGAGKSTLLRTVAGLVAPAGGVVEVDGLDVRRAPQRVRARRLAFVDQRPTLPPGMTVAEYVLLGRHAHVPLLGVEGARDRAVVAESMARLDVARFADRDVLTLSGGEAQRVVLARALAQEAPVLLLDEPTTALDLAHQHQVLEVVDELRRELDLTVVTALHDLTAAGQFAVDAALLACGELMASGPVEHVLDADLLGTAYGTRVRILDDGAGGTVVLPVRNDERSES